MAKNKQTQNAYSTDEFEFSSFQPSPTLAAQLKINRAGKLTRLQKNGMRFAALGSSCGLLVIVVMVVNVLIALVAGVNVGSAVSVIFFVFFVLSFGYLAGTLYFNARMFLPDVLGKNPVKRERGKLKIRMADRNRPELPFSYIVGSYSFAPYVVSAEIPLEKGREYVVYYAASSRMFLNIEPAEFADREATVS